MSMRSIADPEQETSQALSDAHQEAQETVRAALGNVRAAPTNPCNAFARV
jgi:hypothetical protein